MSGCFKFLSSRPLLLLIWSKAHDVLISMHHLLVLGRLCVPYPQRWDCPKIFDHLPASQNIECRQTPLPFQLISALYWWRSWADGFHSPLGLKDNCLVLVQSPCRKWFSYPFPSNSWSYLVLTQGLECGWAPSDSPLKHRQAPCGHTMESGTSDLLFVLILSYEHPLETCGKDVLC